MQTEPAPTKRARSSVERPIGPRDERLQQPAFRVAGDSTEREEDGEHDAEEQRREHGQPDEERARERARVDVHVGRRRDGREISEDVVVREPEEEEEGDREDDDDGEHLAANGLAEAVADDDAHGAHDVSPPTASR